jgi:diadenylate cyclase
LNLLSFFSQFRWQDAFDIALCFVVIYRLLLLIRGTRAVQILMGLGVLSIAFIISDWLRLFVFNYLLRQVFEYLFIIVVVLFQEEIRRALANIGRNPFLSGNTEKNKAIYVLDEICRASQSLAANRIGGLIVLERQHGLKNYTEGAVKINAEVTAELLVSIFQASSPIHDGAVIVEGGKILAAGCFVPVSLESNVDRNLGTRHRAALGISMETDAVVVVLSEERGEIALAESGTLQRALSSKELKNKLMMAFDLLDEPQNITTYQWIKKQASKPSFQMKKKATSKSKEGEDKNV